jgi:hypothetical protein
MESINVSDLPEPVARVVAAMVDELRRELAARQEPPRKVPELPRLEGNVMGTLTREELYGDES